MLYSIFRVAELDGIILSAFLAFTLYMLLGSRKAGVHTAAYIAGSTLTFVFCYYLYKVIPFLTGSVWDIPTNPYWYYFVCMIGTALLWSHFLLQGSLATKITYILFFMTSILMYKIVCSPLYINEFNMSSDLYRTLDILTTLLEYVLLFLLGVLFRNARIRISLASLPKKVLLALYFPLSFLFCYLILFINHLEQSNYSAAILAAIILTNLPVIYYLFVSVIRTYEEQRRLDDALAQTQAQLSRYRFSLELEEQLSKERHELKNRYFYIQTLLKEQKYDKLDSYLNDVLNTQLSSKQNIYTGNTLMDYLINRKLQEAQKIHIVTSTEILVPSQLPLSDDTLCTILLNLLDNAIEASRSIRDPHIQITVKCIQNYLSIRISNKVNENILEKNPSLRTTKKDTSAHGLGIRIIKNAVSSCNGIYDVGMDGNYFVSTVMLPLNGQEE